MLQAEDGIRDVAVTGVQTCALPIWPEQIRLGSGAYGWAMLGDVPVWYEIWRQLNGFPPNLEMQELGEIGRASCRERV